MVLTMPSTLTLAGIKVADPLCKISLLMTQNISVETYRRQHFVAQHRRNVEVSCGNARDEVQKCESRLNSPITTRSPCSKGAKCFLSFIECSGRLQCPE